MSNQTRRYTQVTKAVYERPWAIQPAMLAVIEEVVRLRLSGSPLAEDDIDTRVSAATNGPRRGGLRAQGVAVIPIYGVISQRMNLMTAMSGGTSVEQLTAQFREALADPDVGAIVFDVDSPGGSVEGITELASEIRAARGQKPMAAVANTTMASAAYWLSSQADEIVATPSAVVGSIGVIGMHLDVSKQDEMVGQRYTLITAGEGKADGNEHEPLSDGARSAMQAMADDYYALFVNDVAKARAKRTSVITDDWKAQIFTAKRAQAAGLADRVETLDATVRRMVVEANGSRASALADVPAPEAIAALLATLPIHEQRAVLDTEGARVAALSGTELRAEEGRGVPAEPTPVVADLDTDQPEEAASPQAAQDWRGRARFEVLEAMVRGGYSLSPREVAR